MNINRSLKILKGTVVQRDLERKELFSQETFHSQNLRYETLKSRMENSNKIGINF